MFKKLLFMKFIPQSSDAGLLVLRIIACGSLFLKHGAEKIFSYSAVYQKMADHHTYVAALGITPSLLCAAAADGICTVLIIVGLFTRWAAVASLLNLVVAWSMVNHFAFFGPTGGHGELIVAYIAAMTALVIAGAGDYSVDHRIDPSV